MANLVSPARPFLTGVEAALRRSAQRARVVAKQTHTQVVIFKNGKIERQSPSDTSASAENKTK